MQINVSMPRSAVKEGKIVMIKVWPKNDSIRKLMKHPTGIAFNLDPQFDPVEWPQDQFTTRRLAEGDVLDHAPDAAHAPKTIKEAVEASEKDAVVSKEMKQKKTTL